MHAEHADNGGLNKLSGGVIGCAFTVLNTPGDQTRRPCPMNRAEFICVLCVHRLSASALVSFLDQQCHKAGKAGRHCTRSKRVRASTAVR